MHTTVIHPLYPALSINQLSAPQAQNRAGDDDDGNGDVDGDDGDGDGDEEDGDGNVVHQSIVSPKPRAGRGQVLTTPSSNYCTSCTKGQPTLDDDEDYHHEVGGGDHDEVVVDGNEDAGLVKDGDGDGASA